MATRWKVWMLRDILFLLLVKDVFSVDQSLFKTCAQSGFCRRLRHFESQQSSFHVENGTLNFQDNVVSLDLLDAHTNHRYTLELSSVHETIFHFEINEKNPLSKRYRVTDDVLAEKLIPRVISVEDLHYAINIIDGRKKAVIRTFPFSMEFYFEEKLFISVNSNGMLRYEHLREKTSDSVAGEWEEEFNGFLDSKPRGPEALGVDFTFHQASVLFGIPEHADDFILKDTVHEKSDPYRLYNLDVNSYVVDSKMALYGAIPVLYGHGRDGCSGIFWKNAAETWIDVFYRKTPFVNVFSESGVVEGFVLLGPSPVEAFQQFTFLTGNAPLPQMYSLGYHQSRWNYDNESDVAMIDTKFEEHGIPLDSIWLDIEYTDGKRYFTWDHKRFPNPLEMISNLTLNGRHLTIIVDPHVKIDENYFFHRDCTALGYYVKNKNGEDYQGWCWPGASSYTDLFNPEARKYYSEQYLLENFKESAPQVGLWNDMKEPAVLNGPEITMPKDNIHYEGWEHRDVHNLYGFYQVIATYDGLARRNEGLYRPFVLSRSFFAGTQRYAAVWTGDNTADWDHLKASIKMCLSLSVSGISFCGADVGGFFKHPSAELLSRWYQVGAFQPFFRSHAHEDTPRREPWLWPEDVQLVIKKTVQKRYRLLPYWYTLFFEHERNGAPIMRPLLAQYPTDPATFPIDSQYLISEQLLVAPALSPGQTKVKVYFPLKENGQPDLWYDMDTFESYRYGGVVPIPVDRFKIPVFQRGGTILPMKNIIRKSSVLMREDPYTLMVALDRNGYAKGTLYVDDEESMEYRSGKYLYYEYELKNNVLSSRLIDRTASYDTAVIIEKVIVIGHDRVTNSVNVVPEQRHINVFNEGYVLTLDNLKLPIKEDWSIVFN